MFPRAKNAWTWSNIVALVVVVIISVLAAQSARKMRADTEEGGEGGLSLNVHLLRNQFLQNLRDGEPIIIGVAGGSISKNFPPLWHAQLLKWLEMTWPPSRSRQVGNWTLTKHTVFNAAMGGTESDCSALCLDSLFRVKPDILFLEFGYNDAGMEHSDVRDAEEALALHPAANYERIARHSIARWSTPVILVEIPSLAAQTMKPDPNVGTSGTAHLIPALRYGLPIVDMGFWWHNWPVPETMKDDGFYGTDTIHILGKGSAILADLVASELSYHISFLHPSVPVRAYGDMTHVYRHIRGPPFHGEIVKSPPTTVVPLPPALYATIELKYACMLPRQSGGNLSVFGNKLVSSSGWDFGTQLRDGGKFRSDVRPGFATYNRSEALVFELPASSKEALVLYRRSWEACAMAALWTSSRRSALEAPANAVMLNGSWSQKNTQMTAAIIKAPLDAVHSYFLFIQNTGLVTTHDHTHVQDAFFKVYGIGESRTESL